MSLSSSDWKTISSLLGGAVLGAVLLSLVTGNVNYSLAGAIAGLIVAGVVLMILHGSHVERNLGIAVLGTIIAGGLGVWGGYRDRVKVNQAILDGRELSVRVTAFFEKEKRLPTEREAVPAKLEDAARKWAVAYEPRDGGILISLDARDPGAGQIRLAPAVAGGTLKWTCRPQEVEAKRLPDDCQPAKP